jgi:hypothetical protein
MSAATLLHTLRASGAVLGVNGGKLAIDSPAPLPDALLSDLRTHKAELLALLAANEPKPETGPQAPRPKVLAMLESRPVNQYAFIVEDAASDPVIVAVAIRGVGTCELLIPRDRYDPFKVMELIKELDSSEHPFEYQRSASRSTINGH